jgi:hypothetical protein
MSNGIRARVLNDLGVIGEVVTAAAMLLLALGACTSLKPVAAEPADLQRQIRTGGLVAVGDDVVLVTTRKREYRFRVTALDADTIRGGEDVVPIDSIVGLQSRKVDVGQTATLVGGLTLGALLVLLFVALSSVPIPA